MTENEPTAEIQDAVRVETVQDIAAGVIHHRAGQAIERFKRRAAEHEADMRELLTAHETEATDAEAMRRAILDALGLYSEAVAAGRSSLVSHDMADRLRQLQRVPIEVRELSQEEMVAAGFLPDAVDVVATPRETVIFPKVSHMVSFTNDCPQCNGTGWVEGTTADPDDGIRAEDCPTCNGTGEAPDPSPAETTEARDEADADRGHDERGE